MQRVHAMDLGDAARREAKSASGLSRWWIVAVAASWWAVIQHQITVGGYYDAAEARGAALSQIFIGATVLFRLLGLALEAGFYRAWWRSWDAPFRFGRFYVWIALCSLIDAWAETLRLFARDHDRLSVVLAPFLGARVVDTPESGQGATLWIAFGSVGLLAAARFVLTAVAQAKETGRGLARPLALTVVAWFVTKLMTWWCLDLLRGMSPVS